MGRYITGGQTGAVYRKQATFLTSQPWVFPATALPGVEYDVRGGGAAGGGVVGTSHYNWAAGGGGGGGARRRGRTSLVPGQSYTMTVGIGGTGVAGARGNHGGLSAIAGVVTARGGLGGFPGLGAQGNFRGEGGPSGDGYLWTNDFAGVNSSGGGRGANNNGAIDGVVTASEGECHGGLGGGLPADSDVNVPVGSGRGAAPTGTGAPGGAASLPGCGGGGAFASSGGPNRAGGPGADGVIDVVYWDTVP